MSVGDIYNACLQDEVAMQPKKLLVSSQFPKRPIPTPRSDLEKPAEDPMGAPAEMAPPLPGDSKQNRKPGKEPALDFVRHSCFIHEFIILPPCPVPIFLYGGSVV